MERPGEDDPIKVPEVENPGFTVYVDIVHGNDENKGSLENPVKTIERGIGILRGYEGRKTLFLREGTYYMENLIVLMNLMYLKEKML